jgi:undecaprenyl-diphosphatase
MIHAIDISVEQFIAPLRGETLDIVMLIITSVFSVWTVVSIIFILLVLAWYCSVCRENALTIIGSILLAVLFVETLRPLFERARPIAIDIAYGLETSYSFPSGHSAAAASFFTCWGLLFWRRITNPFLRALIACGAACAMMLIALSRVYLRVHFTTDVLGGILVGVCAACIAVSIKTCYNKKR